MTMMDRDGSSMISTTSRAGVIGDGITVVVMTTRTQVGPGAG